MSQYVEDWDCSKGYFDCSSHVIYNCIISLFDLIGSCAAPKGSPKNVRSSRRSWAGWVSLAASSRRRMAAESAVDGDPDDVKGRWQWESDEDDKAFGRAFRTLFKVWMGPEYSYYSIPELLNGHARIKIPVADCNFLASGFGVYFIMQLRSVHPDLSPPVRID